MPDQSTGATGTMRITDTGSIVEFWLNANQPSSNFGSLTFSWSSPHGSGTWSAGYPAGSGWRKMGEINVTVGGTVSWTMPYTGTSAFGGPTTQSMVVSRATVPPAPTQVTFSQITQTSVRTAFNSQGTGGSAILQWQLSFGTNGSAIEGAGNSKYTSSGTLDILNLIPGRYYAAWARGRNALGWGPWSKGNSFYTLGGALIKVNGVWIKGTFHVKVDGVWKPAVAYVKDDDVWKIANI